MEIRKKKRVMFTSVPTLVSMLVFSKIEDNEVLFSGAVIFTPDEINRYV